MPLTIDAAVTVEFPGPLAAQVTGGATVAITVPWDEAEPHRTVVGTGDGAVTILRYDAFSDAFVTASRTLLGGRVTGLAPLLDAAGEVVQLAVATVDPDRVVICDLFRSGALLVVRQTIELEEDPAGLDGLGVAGARTDALAVGLVGLDRIQLLERGPLEWGITATFDSGDGPRVLVGTDLDGDGRDELAVAHVGALSNSVSVFIWTDGHLDFVEDRRLVASPVGLAAMDREGDGRSELVALTAGTALAHELAWNGSSLAVVRDITLTLDAESLATGRLPDGRTGLYVANRERALVEAFLTGGGGWQRQDSYYPACQPGALVAAEFNRDGRVDLVSLGSAKNLVTLMLGSNDDGFWGYPVLSLSGTPAAMTRGDFNGDGLLDVAVISNFSDVLSVFLGHGDGLATVPVDRALGFLPGDLVPLQVDADPEYEIAIVSLGDRGVRVIDRSPTGDWTTLTTVVMDERPSQLRTADVDGDGATDLVALDNTVPEVTVLFGDGAGAFPASTTTGFVWQAHDVVAVDLDADGDRELVATDGFFRIQIRTNLDGRSFGDESRVNAATGAGPLCVGDLDGDLDEDVVVANVEESSLTFLENIGDGTLVRRIGSYAVPGSPENLTVADMNDDGIADIVINLRENGTVAILLGFGNWTWTPADEYVVAGDIVFFFAADVNADQIPDILTLDATLNLGLALLNMERTTVSTGPVPLEASCEAGDLVVQVRPGDAKWWLDAGLRGVWRPMADRHGTLAGHLERIGDAWRLVVPGGDLTAVDLPAGADRLRLRMGDGEGVQEFLADLPGPCAPGEPSSAVAWSREPWPNPFNPVIHARFTLEKPSRISAGVYDLQGRLVHELLAGRRAAGDHVLRWDGTVAGRPGSAGVYLLRVETERAVLARKVVLLK
ncbi:MAG: hypothetical protein GY838_08325 [bacterium]|nr:hypothetical protein [bacterium]